MDPKLLKKHSSVARKHANNIIITGAREKTETGFKVPGHSGKDFETFAETLLPGTASALCRHPKKDRVVRILAGGGYVILDDGTSDPEDKRIHPGDEVILRAGVSYRFATTSGESLEMHVSQGSKYDARLEILEEASATVEVTPGLLNPAERAASAPPGMSLRRGSKAKQQQLSNSGNRSVKPAGQIDISAAAGTSATAEMNVRPSMGRFSDEGAG